jgi:hypothetical protein
LAGILLSVVFLAWRIYHVVCSRRLGEWEADAFACLTPLILFLIVRLLLVDESGRRAGDFFRLFNAWVFLGVLTVAQVFLAALALMPFILFIFYRGLQTLDAVSGCTWLDALALVPGLSLITGFVGCAGVRLLGRHARIHGLGFDAPQLARTVAGAAFGMLVLLGGWLVLLTGLRPH